MIQTTEGIVLNGLKIVGGRQIVSLYTEGAGRLSFVFNAGHSRRSAVRASLFQPLAVVQVTADIRPNVSLHRLQSVSAGVPYKSLNANPYKAAMVLFLQDFLYHSIREEGVPNVPLYRFILTSLKWLDAAERDYANFHIAFLLRVSTFLGLRPNTEYYDEGDCFDLLGAGFVKSSPAAHPYCLPPQESAMVRELMRINLSNMQHFRLNRAQRNRIIEVANTYYRLHIPDFPELKSLQVLKELFDD